MSLFRSSPIFTSETANASIVQDLQIVWRRSDLTATPSTEVPSITITVTAEGVVSWEAAASHKGYKLYNSGTTENNEGYAYKTGGYLVVRTPFLTGVFNTVTESIVIPKTGVYEYCVLNDIGVSDVSEVGIQVASPLSLTFTGDSLALSVDTSIVTDNIVTESDRYPTALRRINGSYPVSGNLTINGTGGVIVTVKGGPVTDANE